MIQELEELVSFFSNKIVISIYNFFLNKNRLFFLIQDWRQNNC